MDNNLVYAQNITHNKYFVNTYLQNCYFMLLYLLKGSDFMPYAQLLNTIIENSNLTVKEIAEKCKEFDVDITPAYISTLRNAKTNRTPSDKVSRAITMACNYANKDALIIEAYLDNAPEPIKKFFSIMKQSIAPLTLGAFDNKLTSQQKREFNAVIDEMSMADFIAEFSTQKIDYEKSKGLDMKIISDDEIKITNEIKQALGFDVADNGMSPLINKGDKVQVSLIKTEEIKTGDIICYAKKEKPSNQFVRKVVVGKSTKEFTFLPINNDFTPEVINIEDIIIIGKVVRVTSEIK